MQNPEKYLPFLTGFYSVAPGLSPMSKARTRWEKNVFQVDDRYDEYIANKAACREEGMNKYYCEERLSSRVWEPVTRYLAGQLATEYPHYFSYLPEDAESLFINKRTGEKIAWNTLSQQEHTGKYLSLFDALCSQVQEDVAVCRLEDDSDWLAAVHLCSPNHWAPAEKIGKPFTEVHAPVAGMQKTFQHVSKMLRSVVEKGPFTRFAWGIATDTRLNHHPVPPAGIAEQEWQGRKIERGVPLYIRTERQNLVGFPDVHAFLFTIRTYFYPVNELREEERQALLAAVRTMSPEALRYKGMSGVTEVLETLV